MKARGVLHKSRIEGINPDQWRRLAELFEDADALGSSLMPHDVGNQTGISYKLAHAVIIALTTDNLADTFLLIYHHGSTAPVADRRLQDGFPPMPWVCPECGEEVESVDDLDYDIACKLKSPVDVVGP